MRGNNAARSFLGWLREYVGDRRRSPRRRARFARLRSPRVAVRVGRIRVGGQYVTDADHRLGVRLELPAGEVCLLAKAVRFGREPEEGGGSGYLLGLRILKVAEDDFALYTGYLKTLMPPERRRCGRESGRLRIDILEGIL